MILVQWPQNPILILKAPCIRPLRYSVAAEASRRFVLAGCIRV